MRQLLTWTVRNPMIVNIIMALIIIAGMVVALETRREVFPNLMLDAISVIVPWPGASAEEVEEGVTILVEEAVQKVTGIDYVESSSQEHFSSIGLVLRTDVKDPQKVLDDVKDAIEQIRNMPEDAEEPVVSLVDNQEDVIRIAIYGDDTVDEFSLQKIAEEIRDDLLDLPEISDISTGGARNREILLEVSDEDMQRYGLTFNEIVSAVSKNNIDVSGGTIKTSVEDLNLRANGKKYQPEDLAKIVVRSFPDGTKVLLEDVADVREDFEDALFSVVYNNRRAILLSVMKSSSEDSLKISKAVKKYVEEKKGTLPEGVHMESLIDISRLLKARISLLLKNAGLGCLLIFVVLMLFLGRQLAFWVAMGLPFAMLGTILCLRGPDITVNMMTLFAFLTVVGLLVDDAIVVSENVQQHIENGEPPEEAAVNGTLEVMSAVVASVITTFAAFAPFFFVIGMWGKFLRPIPWVSSLGLFLSLFECLFILPCHLAHTLKPIGEQNADKSILSRMQRFNDRMLNMFIEKIYRPLLRLGLKLKWEVFILGFGLFIITIGVTKSGLIKFVFMPEMDSDWIKLEYTLEPGSSENNHDRVMSYLFGTIDQLEVEFREKRKNSLGSTRRGRRRMHGHGGDEPVVVSSLATIGLESGSNGLIQSYAMNSDSGEIVLELMDGEYRGLAALDFINRWREIIGDIPGTTKLNFKILAGPPGVSIVDVRLTGDEMDELMKASSKVQDMIREYPGVYEIQDNLALGKRELKLKLNERGISQGLTLGDLIVQVRQGFYGQEIHSVMRGRDEVKIWARYPEEERRSIADLEAIKIWSPVTGAQLFLTDVADVEISRQLRAIHRHDRKRTLVVSAKLDTNMITPEELKAELKQKLPELLGVSSGVKFSLEGQDRDQRLLMESLSGAYPIALVVIFLIIAVAFRNFLHSAMIVMVVPLGLVGAVAGHFILPIFNSSLGKIDLTMLSVAGVVALAGIVVNDTIVMVDAIKRNIAAGMELVEAVHEGAVSRFRPILLTTLTTCFGMMPLMLEKSLQAQFLIPMAVSISFGLLFGTFFTQLWMPSAFLVFNDLKVAWYLMAKGKLYRPVVIERNGLPDGNFIKGVIPSWMIVMVVGIAVVIYVLLKFKTAAP